MTSSLLRGAARLVVARRLNLRVDGTEHIPAHGPAVIACHHIHHLYDACALMAATPREVHFLVGLDWVGLRLRPERLGVRGGSKAYRPSDAQPCLRRAVHDSIDLLQEGRVLIVFPEGYPNIDPTFTPKSSAPQFLQFRPGFARLCELAGQRMKDPVPIIPAGLDYHRPGRRWDVHLRFGPAILPGPRGNWRNVVSEVADAVHALSAAAVPQR